MGNRLIISAAIFTDPIYADELLSIKLYFGPHASGNVIRVARVFVAINKCMERLHMLYRSLGESTHSIPPAKVLWPNPIANLPKPAEATQGLEFFCKVDRSLPDTPINQTLINEDNKCHAYTLQG